jgi:hypothetical protein
MAVSIPGCEPVALDFVGWPDSATPNPEEHRRLGWCTFRAGDLIVVDGKVFAAVFLVRFIAPTSRLHAVKADCGCRGAPAPHAFAGLACRS